MTYLFRSHPLSHIHTHSHEDSVFVLAQAGEYIGPKAIEEYVKFSDANFNQFWSPIEGGIDNNGLVAEERKYLGFQDGICSFSRNIVREYLVSEEGNGDRFYVSAAAKLYFDYSQRYFTRFNLYYPTPFLEYSLGTAIPADAAANFICSVLSSTECENVLGPAPTDCLAQVAALPVAEGEGIYVDSDSRACRILHAELSLQDPALHCPHVSLTPMADSNGKVKCQVSEQIQVSDLFSEAEIEEFNTFASANGVDPTEGYKLIEAGGN